MSRPELLMALVANHCKPLPGMAEKDCWRTVCQSWSILALNLASCRCQPGCGMRVTSRPQANARRDGIGSALASSQFAPATASCDHAPEDLVGSACDEPPCSLPDRRLENDKAVEEEEKAVAASRQAEGDCV